MLRGSWSTETLALAGCQLEIDANSLVIWHGPRICMGICEGEPSLVCPHSTSGRADYFGPVVNRWADPLITQAVHPLVGQRLDSGHTIWLLKCSVITCCDPTLMHVGEPESSSVTAEPCAHHCSRRC